MGKIIDCFFVGHNEMGFAVDEKLVRATGVKSGAYRELNKDAIRYNGKLYTAPEIFNLFYYEQHAYQDAMGPCSLGNLLSATIAYLGTYLSRRGFTFDYVNSFRDEKQYLIEKLQEGNIRVVAVPTTLYLSVHPLLEIIALVKKYNNTAKIIVGGPLISSQINSQPDNAVQHLFRAINADFYINSSQGEAALTKVVHAVKNNLPVDNIHNIIYRNGKDYVANASSAEDNNLEENMVDWSLFADRMGKMVSIRTSTSCPFSCAYCEFPARAGKYKTAGVEAIEREFNILDKCGKVTGVWIIDDTFNIPTPRFKDFLRMMIKNRYGFQWSSFFRCQFADREMVELMKESGCQGVFLGIESGSQKILDNMNKATTVDKYRRGIALLKEYGIPVMASFLIGFPGETRETFQETVRFIEDTQPDFYHPHLWHYTHITPIWREREKYQIQGSRYEWSHGTMDAATASDLAESMLFNVKNSVDVPQYNFDFLGVIGLLQRGLPLERIKHFLNSFNDGLREKLRNPGQRDISPEVAEKLRMACTK